MPLSFAVTWDYRCPFARNGHDHVIEGLLDGADWEVTFVPFCLGQTHVEDGEPDIWERPDDDSGLKALQVGVVVRDQHPELFLRVHRGLFAARHEHGHDLRDDNVLGDVLCANGVDPEKVLAEVATGAPLETVRKEHETAVGTAEVWGVPTFMADDSAVFVRLMEGADGDPAVARTTIERVVALLTGWPNLNEFKRTSIPR